MAAPRASEAAAEEAPQPFCSSVLCKALSSVPFFAAGAVLMKNVRNAVNGQPERLRKPSVFASMGFAIGLIAWGLTLLVHAPKKRNP